MTGSDAIFLWLGAGITSENVSAKYNIPREAQDKMAARSHARAAAATASGRFKDEIVPVHTVWKDPKTGEEKSLVVDKDDGVRPGVSAQQLAGLKAVFKKGGTTTAGNSSQVCTPVLHHSPMGRWDGMWPRCHSYCQNLAMG